MCYSYALSYIPVEFLALAYEAKEFIQNNRKMKGVIVQSHGNIFIHILTKNYLFLGLI